MRESSLFIMNDAENMTSSTAVHIKTSLSLRWDKQLTWMPATWRKLSRETGSQITESMLKEGSAGTVTKPTASFSNADRLLTPR